MMRKALIILPFIAIIALAVALSGCQPVEQTGNMTTTGTAYIGGTEGLEMSFLANAPPSIVYDKPASGSASPFEVGVKIENKGEYTIPTGKYRLSISGIDARAFGKTQTDFSKLTSAEDLMKTRRSGGQTIAGTFAIISIPSLAYQSPVSGQIGPFNLRASVCYEYSTEASSNICVLTDMLGTRVKEGLCNPNEKKQVENSGAPVGVISLEQSVTGSSSTAFTFIIKHMGGEKNLVFKNEDQSCQIGDMSRQDKLGVKVELGTTDITSKCSGINSGVANLYGDTGAQIRCSGTLSDLGLSTGDFVQPVKVTLTYDYYEYTDQQLTVKQVGT
jgi:hypothetical protein